MRRIASVLVLLAACGGSSKPAADPQPANETPLSNHEAEPAQPKPQSEVELAIAKLVEFQAAMCVCKDPDCAKRVSDEMTRWSIDHTKHHSEQVTFSEAEENRLVEIGTKMGECMQAAMGMGSPGGPATP